MAVKDVKKQSKTPVSGTDAGNQGVNYYNFQAEGVLYLPTGVTNTLNGGKDRPGAIRVTNTKINIHVGGGVWLEYASLKDLENYVLIPDGLKYVENISVVGLDVTIVSPVRWRINQVDYEKLTNTIFSVPATTSGYSRIDLIYADINSSIYRIQGDETTGIAVEPILPISSVKVTLLYVSDNVITPPIPDLADYLTVVMADIRYIKVSPDPDQHGDISITGIVKAKRLNITSDEGVTSEGNLIFTSDVSVSGANTYFRGGRIKLEQVIDSQELGDPFTLISKDANDFITETTLKTVNGNSLFGIGNIVVSGGGGGDPAGNSGNIQFNDAGDFGASDNFTWNEASKILTILGDIFLEPNGTDNRTISFRAGYNKPAILLYDGGSNKYGWGLRPNEMQLFIGDTDHYSWNKGGDLQPSGTNELMRLSANTGDLEIEGNIIINGTPNPGSTDGARMIDLSAAVASGIGVTVNSTDISLALTARGYYNYTGVGNATWTLPAASTSTGMFYRIYNKTGGNGGDNTGTLTLDANGTEEFFRSGVWQGTLPLAFGESVTLQCDGAEWNVYG